MVKNRSKETLQEFVAEHAADDAEVYTDDFSGYKGLPNHETVRHSVREYVAGHVHTNGIESFWSMLKRAHKGVYHKLSPKRLAIPLHVKAVVFGRWPGVPGGCSPGRVAQL